jgi:hypothetical protein
MSTEQINEARNHPRWAELSHRAAAGDYTVTIWSKAWNDPTPVYSVRKFGRVVKEFATVDAAADWLMEY